jgi:hypothetical protein
MASSGSALSTSHLRVLIDPRRGAEIRSIVESRRGCELLFQAPWTPREPLTMPASSQAWVEAWPGGWQLLFPNAGAQSVVDERRHGFHGDASLSEWRIQELDERRVKATWRDSSGLIVIREIALDGQAASGSERTATDVADRLSRAWSSIRERGSEEPGEGEAKAPLFADKDADPDELFSQDRPVAVLAVRPQHERRGDHRRLRRSPPWARSTR